MHAGTPAAFLLAILLGAPAQAQVYRCGDARVYTDRPCPGATPVDVRPNLFDAGPRVAPADNPAPPIILKEVAPTVPAPSAGSDLWQRRDSSNSEYLNRTTGTYRR